MPGAGWTYGAVRSGGPVGGFPWCDRGGGTDARSAVARDLPAMTDQLLDDVVATSDEGRRAQALRRLKKRRDFGTHVSA